MAKAACPPEMADTGKTHRRGGSSSMMAGIRYATGEPLPIPAWKRPEQGNPYNPWTGKRGEDGRESDRGILAGKFRNGNGAKAPYRW
ncbi:hypothetical protein [Parapedobacter soli]|uniref:hypothetical protein n=1 Tax=Parapedobacter soli TaxID=416955 RepID=UPI0021C93680|nr:hypothetical protein [Parapedobacter soli]